VGREIPCAHVRVALRSGQADEPAKGDTGDLAK
jgi:hypothetical protein